MHASAFAFVARAIRDLPPRRAVCELGSRDVNGSCKQLFMGASRYVGVDIAPGDGVDVVADAATFRPDFEPDTVVCCEVLEHAQDADRIVQNALAMLAPGGIFVMTCATDPRDPHSAEDGAVLRDGEFYRNVDEQMFRYWCFPLVPDLELDERSGDLRAVVWKGA